MHKAFCTYPAAYYDPSMLRVRCPRRGLAPSLFALSVFGSALVGPALLLPASVQAQTQPQPQADSATQTPPAQQPLPAPEGQAPSGQLPPLYTPPPPPVPQLQQPPQVPQVPQMSQVPGMQGGPVVQMRTTDLAATLFQLQGESYVFVVGRRYAGYRRYQNWGPVCRAPCGMAVNPNGVYSIRGRNIVPSGEFMLPTSGLAQVDVNAGHQGARAGGVILTTFGGMATAVGIVFTAIGLGRQSTPFITGGVSTLAIGGGMLAGGIAIIVATKTRVYTTGGLRIASLLAPRSGIAAAGF